MMFGSRLLAKGEGRFSRCFETECWRGERTECDNVCEKFAVERKGGVRVIGNNFLERR